MTPQDFVAKWRASSKDERRHSHSHFNDLCALLGVADPATAADPGFTFEKGAAKATGGSGWADVWRRGAFGWEYKSHRANLDDAHRQLLMYSAALENPPLLIASDMERIVVHTNWTNTVQQVTTPAAIRSCACSTRSNAATPFIGATSVTAGGVMHSPNAAHPSCRDTAPSGSAATKTRP